MTTRNGSTWKWRKIRERVRRQRLPCALCTRPIDYTATPPDPQSFSLDHIVPYNGHNTVEHNLQALCPRHHHLKHESDWQVRRLDDGSTEWTSPTGRKYVKPPPQPDDHDPP